MTRLAIVTKDKCNPIKCDWLCFKLCPLNRTGKECILKEEKAAIDEKLCTGCGICQTRCQFKAIMIINLPEKLKENPIHRYGKNAFELFRLPLIKKNAVVGIIGRNGIGKSTALSILSGELKPNLGDYETQQEEERIIERYSTSYLGEYFKNLFNKKIKISYKPQRIELLPELYDEKLNTLIKKVDERGVGEKLMKELELDHLKDKKLSSLSGGELQRAAITATIVKKADVYYLDEPASFLDVTQRIKVAKIIRELAKGAPVLVVEHDLATLDYISDEIQIVYGQPAGYGVISQSKGVRRGINEYLDGYLDNENIRFRNYSIEFSSIQKGGKMNKEVVLKIPELEKKFNKFSLKVKPCNLHKQEVLCVMGANGLGKTTFLNLLAGLIKPDKGKLEKIDVAYKMQYLKPFEGTVLEHLKKVAGPELSNRWYRSQILEKLNLNNILNNEIKDLSGGELQKVHIATVLSSNSKIIALDEPSAFIDIEDRLKVAEIIKEFVQKKEICAIVVDHDIQFVDYLADSMLVFKGVPSKNGEVMGILSKIDGINSVLKMLEITYRRDPITNRPRVNKPGSQLDRQQKTSGEYYYV